MILPLLLVLVLQDGTPRDAAAAAAAAAVAPRNVQTEESLFGPEPGNAAFDPPRNREGELTCDRGGNTLQMNACVADDLALEQARMQRYLDVAMEQAAVNDSESGELGEPTRQVELLTAAQAAWIAYADLRCETQWDEVKGGTIRTIVLIGCWIDATRLRTHDIWADHLTYWDSTPPVLPEPVLTVFEEQQAAAQRP